MSDNANKNDIMEFFSSLIQDNESIDELQNFLVGFVALVFTCAVFYIAYNDPNALTDQFYVYTVFGILPIVIGIIITSKLFSVTNSVNKFYFYGGILFVFICAMYTFYRTMNPNSVSYISYILGLVSLLIFIVGLAIVYRIFVRTIINTRGWIGFFLKFLFLIPCLLIELLETIFKELKAAPKMVVVLFILEILIILVYIYMPRIANLSSDSIVLLNKPVFLSNSQVIGRAKQLFMDENDEQNPGKSLKNLRLNYSISMWIYVNQHSNSYAAYSKETNIFRYGYPNHKNGHPRLSYFNDTSDTNKTDKFIVYINDSANDSVGIPLQIPTQSWNQLVISYNESSVDIFINGNLEKSVPQSAYTRPDYNPIDLIEVGEGDNTVTKGGLSGGICNVVYHKTPLTPYQVAGDYNVNRYKNPPVNS